MNQNHHNEISRRSLLRIAGGIAGTVLTANSALARRLILVASTPDAPISQVEWILYDTGRLDALDAPVHRCAVRLTTTAGKQGWADFDSWVAPDGQMAALVESILLGQDPANHESLWKQLYGQAVPIGALSAVDVALWDLRARIEGKPVHSLLGTKRESLPGYVSSGSLSAGPTAYADFAVACKEREVAGVKVQPTTGNPVSDLAVYEAVRGAVGPDFACFAGGPGTYTAEQALQVGQGLDPLGYAWYQSPMPESDESITSYVTLAEALETPICAPKDAPGSYQSRLAWIEQEACDIACIDVHHGGFTACLQLAAVCQSEGIALELPNIGPDAYAHLQLAAASDATTLPRLELLSLSQEPDTLPGRVTPEPVFGEDGHIAIPQTVGMGLELDWKYIFTHRVG